MVQILTIFIHIRHKLESDAPKLGYYNISTSSKTWIQFTTMSNTGDFQPTNANSQPMSTRERWRQRASEGWGSAKSNYKGATTFLIVVFLLVIVVLSCIWTSYFSKIGDMKSTLDTIGADIEVIKTSSGSIDSKLPDLTQPSARVMSGI